MAQTGEESKKALTAADTTTAQLYARPTGADNPKLHAFWVIKGEDEYYILTGGPGGNPGKVTGWVDHAKTLEEVLKLGWKDAPNETVRKQETKLLGTFQVSEKFRTYNGAAALNDKFNATIGTRGYNPNGPNSNTFARVMGQGMGAKVNLSAQKVELLRGWNWAP